MEKTEPIHEENWVLFAVKSYQNPGCHSTQEFLDDMQKIKYIRKLITSYEKTGILKERLILNHIICLNNVLGPEALCRILFLKLNEHLSFIKPFLVLLSILPETVSAVGKEGKDYHTDDIPMSQEVVRVLRENVMPKYTRKPEYARLQDVA